MLRCLAVILQRISQAELASKPDAVVLDLGCGERPYEQLFTRQGARYIGVDVKGNPAADIMVDPNGNVPMDDESVDVVLSSQVLEHVVDVPKYLLECHRLLRREGLLILSTHGCWTYHPYPVDVRRWTCWGLRHDIESLGFRVESIEGCLGPLAYTTQLRLQLVRGFLWRFGSLAHPIIHGVSLCAQLLMWCEDRITPRQLLQENSAIYVVAARKLEDR